MTEVDLMTTLQTYTIFVPTNTGRLESINFYLVIIENKVILIDAGEDNEKCWDALLKQLKELQLTVEDIDAILLTHNHSDHTGLVNRIRKIHNIPVYAHKDAIIRLKRERTFLETRIKFYENLFKEMGCGIEADKQIQRLERAIDKNAHQAINGDIIPIEEDDSLYGFDIYEVPGHAPDHVIFRHDESKIMFVGDHILKNSPTNALVECDPLGNRLPTLIMYEQSLKKLQNFSVEKIYPGHGEVIENSHSLVKRKLERIEKKGQRIKQKLTEHKTASQIAKEMYGERYDKLFPLIMSEVIGHLDRLLNLNEITVNKQEGIYYFSS